MSKEDDDAETEFVQLLVKFNEVFVYKVPPLTSVQAGHRAETWGLEKPFATSTMKVLAKGDVILLQIFSSENPSQLVAACPIALATDQTQPEARLEYWVESVKDSARYFVVRMVDAQARKQALLGIGFRERNSAFEFQEALNHHFNRVMRLRGVVQKPDGENLLGDDKEEVDSSVSKTTQSFSDLSLKKPIKLSFPSKKEEPTNAVSKQAPALQPSDVDDEEWGEFQ